MARGDVNTVSGAVAGAVLALVVLTGCGGHSGKRHAERKSELAPKRGGEVTYLSASDVDFLDPGQTYYTFGYMVHYAVNRTLYSFKPNGSQNPVPDLAAGPPRISSDNKTVTVRIRRGVRYAPPVNREVTSRDIQYGLERAFSANVPSSYATSYFGAIQGAPQTPSKGVERIPGIQTPDDRTVVLRLSRPSAATVAAALVMPITTPVPEEYARKHDRNMPSTYDEYVAFTGPYMVRNRADGKVVGREPGKRIEIVRNPNWDRTTDYRPAYLDAVTIQEGNSDLAVASRRTLRGSKLMCCDSTQPPIAVLKEALARSGQQVGRVSSGSTHWIALNTTQAPFDDINIRRAVIAGFDRNALRLTRGGKAVGPVAQHFIPPGLPGFEESGGAQGFTDLDFMRNTRGDMGLAAKYFRAAGQSSGRYEGTEALLTVAANASPDVQTALVAQAQFEKLGFRLKLRNLDANTMFTKFCSVPDSGYAICPNVAWFRDISDPQSMLEPTFSGAAIKPQANVNWSQLADPEIDRLMTEAATIPAGVQRNAAWAAINRLVVEQAVAIPYVWDDVFQLSARNVRGAMNGYYASWDLSFSSLK
jgi:peptide/nickel transport system substrate-binding protein